MLAHQHWANYPKSQGCTVMCTLCTVADEHQTYQVYSISIYIYTYQLQGSSKSFILAKKVRSITAFCQRIDNKTYVNQKTLTTVTMLKSNSIV